MYGYHPQPLKEDDWDTDLPNVPAEARLQELKKKKRYGTPSNHRRSTAIRNITFVIGDLVMQVSKKNLTSWRPSKKLDDKLDGPLEVTKVVGKQAYSLRLPKSSGKVHPTFHVSLLEQNPNLSLL
jgi:hypothetical protein